MTKFTLATLFGAATILCTVGFATDIPRDERIAIESAMAQDLVNDLGFRCCASAKPLDEHGPHCVQAATKIGGDERAKAECDRYHKVCVSDGCKDSW
jgi:hypothetical protein